MRAIDEQNKILLRVRH